MREADYLYASDPFGAFIAYTLACEVTYTRAYESLAWPGASAYTPKRETSLAAAPEDQLPTVGTPEWIAEASEILDHYYAQTFASEFSDATATTALKFSEPVAVLAPHVSRRLQTISTRPAARTHAPRRWPLPRLLPLAAAHASHAPPAVPVLTRRAA